MNVPRDRSTRRPAKYLALLLATAIAAVLVAPTAAGAATGTTFAVTAGGLTIVDTATAVLADVAPGAVTTGALGAVTVTDARANLAAAWTASAISTTFTTGAASPAETVPVADVTYWSGPGTATTGGGGGGAFTPGQLAAVNAAPVGVALTSYALTGGVGNSSQTWDPTLIVAVPLTAVAGPYAGTVTDSVA